MHEPSHAKQTNTQKAHKPALLTPSKLIVMLKKTEKHKDKHKAKLNINRLVELLHALGHAVTLNTDIHKNSGRIMAPNSSLSSSTLKRHLKLNYLLLFMACYNYR